MNTPLVICDRVVSELCVFDEMAQIRKIFYGLLGYFDAILVDRILPAASFSYQTDA